MDRYYSYRGHLRRTRACPPAMTSPHDLKSAGLKATLPRLKIINLFETSKVRHLTAEDVYRILLTEGLDIGLATVCHRVLTQFEQAGLLVRHHFESGKAADMAQLRGVLLHVHAVNADVAEPPAGRKRHVVLADLVALGEIGIEVVLTVEGRPRGATSQPSARAIRIA